MRITETDLNYFEVGGSVRDELLDKEPSDRDFVIVGHTVEEVEAALGKDSKVVGEAFPVFLDADGNECAMARTEEKVARGHQGFTFNTSPDITIEEDLARRDLTINAMAKDPETGEIIDPFDGQADLEMNILRHTTAAFAEDPLRVLRIARFAAKLDTSFNHLGWTVAEETKALCRRVAPRLDSISEERIADEMLKTFRTAPEPSTFFRVLDDLDALNVAFPEVNSLRRVPAGPGEHHAEGTAFEHTMRVLDEATPTVRLRLAALAHDFGKARTPTEKLPAHHGHDKEGVPIAERFGNRLELSNEHIGVMMDAAEHHMRWMRLFEMRASKVLELIETLDRSPTHLSPVEMTELCDADGRGREPQTPLTDEQWDAFVEEIIAARETIDAIGGKDVLADHPDKEPGPWVGEVITQERVRLFRKHRQS